MVPEALRTCQPHFIEDGGGNTFGYYMIPRAELAPPACRDEYVQGTPRKQLCGRTLRSDSMASLREVGALLIVSEDCFNFSGAAAVNLGGPTVIFVVSEKEIACLHNSDKETIHVLKVIKLQCDSIDR